MKQFFRTKKGLVLLATMVVAAIAAVGATAYFTTTGSGTGSAAVGTSSALTINQVGSVTNLLPGAAAQPIEYSVQNTSAGHQYVGPVTVSIASVTQTVAGAAAGTCDSSDFTLVQPNTVPGDIAPGATYTSNPSGASIQMINKASNQDGCKGATVNLSFSA
jgi:hypothetical protein